MYNEGGMAMVMDEFQCSLNEAQETMWKVWQLKASTT